MEAFRVIFRMKRWWRSWEQALAEFSQAYAKSIDKKWIQNNNTVSAGADGGPRSQVCAHLTIRLAPH